MRSSRPPETVSFACGVWTQVLRVPAASRIRPALFLDRDGVIVEDVGYLHRTEDVRLMPAAENVIAEANACDVRVVIVTNQSGIGRGLYGWTEFAAVQDTIVARLAAAGAQIDAVYACPHHPEAIPPYQHPDPPARKPNPGMLLAAAEALPIDLSTSWIIGDRGQDLEAGRRAGLAGGVLIRAAAGSPEDGMIARTPLGGGFLWRHGRSIADALTLPLFGAGAHVRP
jgi:D-glycero-D-manno-heptose 1,7-bisphosphate phosphatase